MFGLPYGGVDISISSACPWLALKGHGSNNQPIMQMLACQDRNLCINRLSSSLLAAGTDRELCSFAKLDALKIEKYLA